jgi:hypothetical protein
LYFGTKQRANKGVEKALEVWRTREYIGLIPTNSSELKASLGENLHER